MTPFNSRSPLTYLLFAAVIPNSGVAGPNSLCAQDPKLPTIVDVQVGYRPLPEGAKTPTHKVGMWTPVFVTVKAPLEGRERGPNEPSHPPGYTLRVMSDDNEDFGVISEMPPFHLEPRDGERRFTLYTKPGRLRGDVRVSLSWFNEKPIATMVKPAATSNLGDYLYLSLGAKLDALADALIVKDKLTGDERKSQARQSRFAVFENQIGDLDGIDLVLLNTGDMDNSKVGWEIPRLLDWVQSGGRLVMAIHPDRVKDIAWHFCGDNPNPPRPPFLAKNLIAIESWAGLQNKPFPARGEPPVPIAQLDPADFGFERWEVQAQLEDKALAGKSLPLIARAAYGFGNITFIAFPLDTGAFTRWPGQVEFLRTLVDQMGPKYVAADAVKTPSWETQSSADWGAQLQRDLDNFDVPTHSFGAVAFLMLLYIVLVSAVDQLVLRRLVGRLEATWVTLPLIVLGVSLATYWTVNSPDDQVIRVNQIDLLDFDFRTRHVDFEARREASSVLQRGSTFFNVRSDRICRLTVSVDAQSFDSRTRTRPAVSWFGRADDGPAGVGRSGGQSLSSKSYVFYQDGVGSKLIEVPFAFRATKSFSADWLCGGRDVNEEINSPKTKPFVAELSYHSRESPLKVSGTLVNHLPFDLEEASLFLFDRVYPLEGGLKKGESRRIEVRETDNGVLPSEWKTWRDGNRPIWALGPYDPGVALRNILFHERLDPTLKVRNHLLRRLDWSWRLRDDPRVVKAALSTLGTQETILVGRGKFAEGDAKALFDKGELPVRVMLESKENGDGEWRETGGRLAHDVYVRAIFPMKPQ